jgi:hypothetical protein
MPAGRPARLVRALICAALILAWSGPSAVAAEADAIISANPNPIPGGPGTGKTTVTWTTADGSLAEVYVSVNDGPEILFAGLSPHGSQSADWFGVGDRSEFRLYAGTAHAKRLATVLVTRPPDSGRVESTQVSTAASEEVREPATPRAVFPNSGVVHAVRLSRFVATLVLGTCLLAFIVAGRRRISWWNAASRADDGASGLMDSLRRSQWLVWLWIATVVFLAANHALVRGLGVGLWDAEGLFYPYQVLVADHARAGRFVSWDPWSSGGLPASGEPQIGAYSPIAIAVGAVMGGTSAGFMTYWLLVWWLGGLGVFLLGRILGAPAWGAFVVALGFLFCGVYTGQAEHTPLTAAFSFLPLVIWRVEAAFLSRNLRPAAEAGALWGLSALAAYPGLVIITGAFVTAWVAGRWLCPEQSTGLRERSAGEGLAGRPSLRFVLMAIALFMMVGGIVMSPTYVAFFFDGAGTHTRVGELSREIAVGEGALHPGALSTFASPYLPMLKLTHLSDLWPYTDPSMVSIYAGAAIPALAVLALFHKPAGRWRWWLLVLAALSLACALGQALPLRGWLYDWVYPMRFFRHAAVFRYYYIFTIAVLALLASRDLAAAFRRGDERISTRFAAAAGVCGAAAVGAFLFVTMTVSNPGGHVMTAYVHAGVAWAGLYGMAALLHGSRRAVHAVSVLLPLLAAADALMTARLSKDMIMNTGGHPLAPPPERWRSLDGLHETRLQLTSDGWRRGESSCLDPACEFVANDQMITKAAVFNAYSPQINLFHREMVRDPGLRGMAVGEERIWFARHALVVPPTLENFGALRERTGTAGTAPLVVHSRDAMLGRTPAAGAAPRRSEPLHIAQLPPAERVPAEIIRYEPAELTFRVQCPSDGWLLVTDRWAPGWRAEIDGRPVPVFGGNFIFRAIQVPAGASEITFRYRSSGFPWLLIASWGTLAAVAVGAAAVGRKSEVG